MIALWKIETNCDYVAQFIFYFQHYYISEYLKKHQLIVFKYQEIVNAYQVKIIFPL